MMFTAEPDELTAFGDADPTAPESPSVLQRAPSFKKPRRPSKRRSIRDLRPFQSDSEGLESDLDRQTRVRFAGNDADAILTRAGSLGGNRLTVELKERKEKIVALEKELKMFEAAQHSLVEDADRWKRKHRDTSKELQSIRNTLESREGTISQLQDTLSRLQQKLNAKEREKATLNQKFDTGFSIAEKTKDEWEIKENHYKNQIVTLTASVTQLKSELAQEKEQYLLDTRIRQQHETQVQAHVIMIKTLEAEAEKYKKLMEEANDSVAFERRRRRADSIGPAGCADHDKMIDELQSSNRTLAEQNITLQEELEHLRIMVSEQTSTQSSDLMEVVPPSPILSPPESPKVEGRPRFPPRTSSAQDLLRMYNKGEVKGSLATELLKTQVQAGVKSELTRLREENIALVNYLAATLDSVAKLR